MGVDGSGFNASELGTGGDVLERGWLREFELELDDREMEDTVRDEEMEGIVPSDMSSDFSSDLSSDLSSDFSLDFSFDFSGSFVAGFFLASFKSGFGASNCF